MYNIYSDRARGVKYSVPWMITIPFGKRGQKIGKREEKGGKEEERIKASKKTKGN